MAPKKHIVFDVVGTCVSFDAYFDRISQILGPRLLEHNINPKHFGYTWMEAAELEFNFILLSERYTPYNTVFNAVFYRTLYMAGISDPREFATDEERDACQAGYSELQLRPGCREMMEKLRGAGWTVWCLTTGDVKRVMGYFEKAGLEMPRENFVSCDQFVEIDEKTGERKGTGVYKPSMAAYSPMLKLFAEEDEKWFAAAHMWDVSAAVKAGFRGAYCTIYEKEPCLEIFKTKMDVMADTLPEMAEKMIAITSP
ncbi:probable 2-haloalkanoic acid dehalogenase [Phialocephala subalpina]|uniref:Probable 2-haloalkanoic acid dehalogenase n=1 Tax=Phialocephala subalpina TaxID=576137 RepID=A0A1L7XQ03_9HELO|nr:probable 2-haloalkanoic acid dehalogenase [Phialocephala subalpina]